MQQPEPGATAPPRRADATTTTGAGFNTLVAERAVHADLARLRPQRRRSRPSYSCDGVGTAPPFAWANVPAGTVELVLLVTDPEANGFIHWMVAGIDPTTTGLGPAARRSGRSS